MEECQNDQYQQTRVDQVQQRCGNLDDCSYTSVGYKPAEYYDGNNQCFVFQFAAGKFYKVFTLVPAHLKIGDTA